MKMFVIPCDVSGRKVPVQFYIGEPTPTLHPINYQSAWISEVRGVVVPSDVMDSLSKLSAIAIENNVSFVDLCTYALNYPVTGESDSSSSEKINAESAVSENAKSERSSSSRKWLSAFSAENHVKPLSEEEKGILGGEEIVLLLSGFNHNGEKIYNYLKIALHQVEKIIQAVNNGGRFDIREFGEVIAAGLGIPSDELRKEMEDRYKMINFPSNKVD